ncbi:MAG TPA: PEP-CTERM sorting domain-containing protein [Rhodocyclaceae bacterium]|nr:PEP-CTERM sorting domain-containing protein [Rhodocyclaceae bacterium]
MKKKLLTLATAAVLAAPIAANALVLTFDDLNPTVERPLSGSIQVNFFGTLTLDPGDIITFAQFSFPCLAPGVCLLSGFGPGGEFDEGHTIRFLSIVDSTTLTGLYASGPNGYHLAYSNAAGQQFSTGNYIFSVNVVDAIAVPEPGTLALAALGLAGIGAMRRRRATG